MMFLPDKCILVTPFTDKEAEACDGWAAHARSADPQNLQACLQISSGEHTFAHTLEFYWESLEQTGPLPWILQSL